MMIRQRVRVVVSCWCLAACAPMGCAFAGVSKAPADAVAAEHAAPPSANRRVEVRGEWLYVDGEPFLVKGVGYSPWRPGQVPWKDRVDLGLMEQDFKRIAEAGFNTIRTWTPLSDEALRLADQYGLMVLQGIWVDRSGNYTSGAFRSAMFSVLQREASRAKQHRNILALLVGNELLPEQVYQVGVPDTEALLKRAAEVVKEVNPGQLVSYANWPSLAFLEHSFWDLVCFNLYPYEPASLSHSLGFRGYIEHLKQGVAHGRPLVISELGLSVSRAVDQRPGYGGYTRETQRADLVKLWDELFQAGAQGGAIFEWNDEWWKQRDVADDEQTHDEADPEEWFGLMEFPSAEQRAGVPRPAYEALKAYNQAILLNPVSGEWYDKQLPVTVYALEGVARVRVRLDAGRWQDATKLNRHWWKTPLSLSPKEKPGRHRFIMEALNANGKVLVHRERPVSLGPSHPPLTLSLHTDRVNYDAGDAMEPITYAITVTDPSGRPVPKVPIHWSIVEAQSKMEVKQTRLTDARGRIEGTYLVHEPGIVALSAGIPRDGQDEERRTGQELFVMVRQLQSLSHRPSPWEAHVPAAVRGGLRHPSAAFQLAQPGREDLVDYGRYGVFHDVGTPRYHYEVTDWEGLAAAVGEGIYPNEAALTNDPAYQAAKGTGKLQGSHWDFTFLDDAQLAFFKWAQAEEEPGVKQFHVALTLERAGQLLHAVKAYYAVLVHFPTSVGWTAFDPPTPWYVGTVARDKIEAILRLHPELGMRLEGARVVVEHGFDNTVDNDVIATSPGTLVRQAPADAYQPSVDLQTIRRARTVGKGRVQLVQYENGHWQLLVEGKPWIIRGLTYQPSQVGESPDEGTLKDWMTADRNKNGKPDGPFDTFVDANRNNRQDPNEPTVGDFQLMHEMGVNTLRLYHHASNKALLRQLYDQYGIRVLMGDFVGMYTVGSGAKWEAGTNYLDKQQRQRMFDSVKTMVREFKKEPYILLWVLGNENNYSGVHGIVGGRSNASQHPAEYYAFINELAQWIHKEDPDHPVAIANGDLVFLDVIAKAAPNIDVFGANVYRGSQGFGRAFFEDVKQWLDKPVVITEFGCPAYQRGHPAAVAERDQALYHLGNWVDLADNMAGRGVGNALGGVVFEWSDEWWKAGQPPRFSPSAQETQPNWAGPFPGGWNFEEWFGLMGQGDGTASPYLRQPRVSYELYRDLWTK